MIDPIYSPDPARYDGTMQYRRCGRSGIRMSALSLGFWHNFGSISNFANCKAMMHYAFDHGINVYDLANNYGPTYGTAEETFGRMMDLSFRPFRDEMFITTKAGYDMWPGPFGDGGSRKYLISSLDQSLRRMKLDYVDLFYSHRYDPNTPLEETLQTLVDIVRSGKALYVGISSYPLEAAGFAYQYLSERDVPCLCFQGKYNILHQKDDKEGILQQADDAGVGYTAFSPLQQGLLTNRYLNGIPAGSRMDRKEALTPEALTPKLLQQIRELNELAQERGESLATMALAWILRKQEVSSVIIGASSVQQLETNLHALESQPFTEEQLDLIEDIIHY